MFGFRHRCQQNGPRLSRRSLIQVGALAGTGLTLVDLLRARGVASETAPLRSVIQVYLGGGPSHFETFDPKPDAPKEIRGPYLPIETNNPGVFVCETLPKLATVADKYSLIRSCCHQNTGHGGGHREILTGYKSASLEFELPHDYPVAGAVVAKVRGATQRGMPTFMQLGGSNDGDPAFLGPAYGSFKVYSTGKPIGLNVNPSVKLNRLEDRRYLRAAFDTWKRDGDTGRLMESMDSLEQQAFEMLSSTRTHDAFDMKKESDETRKRYGDHDAGKSCLLARRFVEAGAGFVSVRMGSWDHHGNAGGTVTSGMQENAPKMDQSVSALIADLADRGLSEQVLVILWGEFGRTPRINNSNGRDHWPQAMSVLLAGGGLKMGHVIGATNKKGEHPIDRACSPADVLATVYRQLGIDTHREFINNRGRPIPILSQGTAIGELV
jgi:uncharacterized protein (DUF1501 family)